ncbi:MAG: neutral/alkaline non-lysosomal ceramidase N-terminal domain-containing protein [Promethearchaeota archaeon]
MNMVQKRTRNAILISMVFICVLMVIPNVVFAKKGPTGSGISVGASKVIITPDTTYISDDGVNDDLYARCIVIEWKGKYVIMVSLDVQNHGLTDINGPIAAMVEAQYGINTDYLLIGSTHSHGCDIDIIGVYFGNLNPYIVNVYKPMLIEKVVTAIGEALNDMRRAEVYVGSIWVEGLTFNRRFYPDPGPTDDELTVLKFVDAEGETIATLVNFATHPVVTMTGHLASADFCGFLADKLEQDHGGIGVYFNGAQGNINPYMYIKYDSPWGRYDDEQYDAAVEYGYAIAGWANQALESAKVFKNLPLQLVQISLELPIENPGFIYLMTHGLILREVYLTEEGWKLTTFISGVRMGPIEMVTVPGELFSEISLLVKSYMPKYGFLLGLTPEQLGYIIPQDQWAPGTGEVGESNSMGYQMAPLITEALLEVVAALE